MAVISKNSMGMLVVNHYTSEDPVVCIGAQLPSPCITEVVLYSASKDTETGEVFRGDLLSKVRMTDLQFGSMISRPNFNEGQVVTIENLDRFNVLPVSSVDQTEELAIQKEISNLLAGGDNGQVSRFLDEMIVRGGEILEKGRMTQSDKKYIKKYTGMLATYVSDSENYALRCINEKAIERVSEVKTSIHSAVKNAYRIGNAPTPVLSFANTAKESVPNIGAAGLMLLSVGNSTSAKLFDDINMDNSVVSISFSVAKYESRESGDAYYRSENRCLEIDMSTEQYARFVRADSIEVPCTITRLFGDVMEDLDSNDTKDVKFQSRLEKGEHYDAYIAKVNDISNGMDNDKFKGKAGLREFIKAVEITKDAYEEYLASSSGAKLDAAKAVFESHQKDVSKFFHSECEKLPSDVKAKLIKPLQGIVSQVDLLSLPSLDE